MHHSLQLKHLSVSKRLPVRQTDTPTFSNLLKSATLNEKMEFKAGFWTACVTSCLNQTTADQGTLARGHDQRSYGEVAELHQFAAARNTMNCWVAIAPCKMIHKYIHDIMIYIEFIGIRYYVFSMFPTCIAKGSR